MKTRSEIMNDSPFEIPMHRMPLAPFGGADGMNGKLIRVTQDGAICIGDIVEVEDKVLIKSFIRGKNGLE